MYYIKNLKYKYKKSNNYILKDVDFIIKPGVLNVLIGENGSGKTTLLDCITQSLKADFEHNLPKSKDILYMTQNIFFAPSNKGKDIKNLIRGLLPKNESEYFDEEIFSKFTSDEINKYQHLLNMKMGDMSVGERKWLYLQLFSRIPKEIYLLDEPTSGVDPLSRKLIMKRIEDIIRHGKQCLISTHQLQDLQHIDVNLIFLNKGKIVYQGDFKHWLKLNEATNPDIAFEKTLYSNEEI
ncbi:AAA family ATPase [Staphylococcus lutrae]|uniref:AAA family ATPase n=1 Tax=Staphylococcus lutrae TaxID=155085 RepID=UPI001469B92D|nr:AAA family ATPase [Staphylococcus lutrae]